MKIRRLLVQKLNMQRKEKYIPIMYRMFIILAYKLIISIELRKKWGNSVRHCTKRSTNEPSGAVKAEVMEGLLTQGYPHLEL